uniref:15-oxoprostaglandin 13-reductase n=1 Tax=Leptobrachium leishanense TaxID=445787 RepID=A0A8C5QZL9_9ANUR
MYNPCAAGIFGEPVAENFRVEQAVLSENLLDGQVLVQTQYLSVDPYLRCQMDEAEMESVQSWKIGGVIDSGGIGIVQQSKDSGFCVGDTVSNFDWPWQTHCVFDGKSLQKMDPSLVNGQLSHFLGAVGTTGLTALLGMKAQAQVVPGANQTLVVSGAAGACGSLAGQIGRIMGCARVVGICGTDEKCSFLVNELGFDGALNYKKKYLAQKLKELCPNGVDIYFDNVGGTISDMVISQMNQNSHVVLCGQISQYNKDMCHPPPPAAQTEALLEERNITRDRFLLFNHTDQFDSSIQQLSKWLKEGKIKAQETITCGLENTPGAFLSMMTGGNTGKQIVQVSQ